MMPPSQRGQTDSDQTLRDVVALSTLPAVWLGAEPLRIIESLAAALFTVLRADLVYVALHGDADHPALAVAQTGRHVTDPALAESLTLPLLEWGKTHDPDDFMTLPHPRGAGTLQVAVRPLAINAEYGLIAAGYAGGTSPPASYQLLMNVAATQATAAIENVRLLRSLRRYAAQQQAVIADAEAARAQAETASRTKDDFLAMLGHELRNPLAPIQTALQLMRLRGDESAARERTVIERQVTHLTRLVDDLLDVSRIARGKVELKRQRLNVAEVVARAIELASPLLEQRRHTLDVQVPRHGLVVDADPFRLAQIVSNLLTNAAKYTPPAGVVVVRAGRREDDIFVSVRDNGIGIAPDMLPRVFELFVQEGQSLDRSQGGLGLGLTIVRSLVAMHGGTVSARSEGTGRGSEFVISLPAAAADAAEPAGFDAGAPPVLPPLDRAVLLIVDDNEDAAAMMAEGLRLAGHEVHVAHDGLQALRIAGLRSFDVAFLDIGLPVMDGYELAARLRTLPGFDRTRLVAITGYGQASDRERTTAAGFHEHFVKPVDLDTLEQLVAQHAGRAAEIDGGMGGAT